MTIFAWGSVLVVLLVLTAPLMLFIQRRYFILAPERLNFFSLLLLRIVLAIVILLFHGYQYQTLYYIQNIFLLWKWSQVKEIEILVHNVFKSCVINFSIEMKLLVILFITELPNFLVRQGGLSVLIRFF